MDKQLLLALGVLSAAVLVLACSLIELVQGNVGTGTASAMTGISLLGVAYEVQ